MFKRKRKNNSDDLYNVNGGIYSFCIRAIPENRICPTECRNYNMVIDERRLFLRCSTLLGHNREWIYILEEEFTDGTLIITLDEKSFNKLMLRLKSNTIVNILSQRKLDIQGQMEIKIKSYRLEKGY